MLICTLAMQSLQSQEIQTKKVSFATGKSSAEVKGNLKGRQTIDYVVNAKQGQQMTVSMTTNNSANYFNILPPGSTGEAIFIGQTEGNNASIQLPSTGDFKVRVYLMPSAGRRNEKAKYTLKIGVTGGH